MKTIEEVRCYTDFEIEQIKREAAKKTIKYILNEVGSIIALFLLMSVPIFSLLWWIIFGY